MTKLFELATKPLHVTKHVLMCPVFVDSFFCFFLLFSFDKCLKKKKRRHNSITRYQF